MAIFDEGNMAQAETQAKESALSAGAQQGKALAGQHAVVTGGGRGIGAAIAEALAALGANVTLMGRTRDPLEETRDRLVEAHGVESLAAPADATDEDAVAKAFAAAAEALGAPQILVNNAGAAESAPFHRADRAHLQWHIDVNLTSTWLCTQAVLPAMREAGYGRIVNVASTAGLVGYRYVSAYCAAKHAVIGLTKSLAMETATKGITVNALCPGYTETDMVAHTVENIVAKTGQSAEEARKHLASINPMGRLIDPQEVAGAAAWLALPGSAAITGQSIAVAAGEVMR